MCAVYHGHFAQSVGSSCEPDRTIDFTFYPGWQPRLSVADVEIHERPITAIRIRNATEGYTRDKSPTSDGLLDKLYANMPDFFDDFLQAFTTIGNRMGEITDFLAGAEVQWRC